nr:chloride channel CLIC-like protein 1 [Misgurnus anguillicaudatus]XP_055074497.1 chloride channel CLIC-like protein 1 [Misgurnus anguillicaudatus]
MQVLRCSLFRFWSLFVFCGLFVIAHVNVNDDNDDEWVDVNDMINYDSTGKCMRKPTETTNTNVQQPKCVPVFKRFIHKLLRKTAELGLPNDTQTVVHYDAEVKLSNQTVSDFQNLLQEDNDWTTGAMDEALSQILVNFKLHDYEAWKWRFEDTFHVELDTVIKILVCVLIVITAVCIEKCSVVARFIQIKRMFYICFFISFIWNWFYLYTLEFAEHQKNIMQMESFNAKCTGVKEMTWMDSLSEWYRKTWTLQDDPCKKYYEILLMNPIFRVSPMKVFMVTLTRLITDPLEQIGQGINLFLRALLKDLPIILQAMALFTTAIVFIVIVYAIIRHILPMLLHGWRHEPPPPAVGQPQAAQLQNNGH